MVLVSATQSIWAEFIDSRDETEVATGLLYFNIYLSLTEYWKKEQGLIGWLHFILIVHFIIIIRIRISFIARYVYTYEEFVLVIEAPQCDRMTVTRQDTDNTKL